MGCQRVREFFHQHNIAFTDRDITKDEAALADLGKLGVFRTPATVVDGEMIVGSDLPQLAAALGV